MHELRRVVVGLFEYIDEIGRFRDSEKELKRLDLGELN